MCGQPDYLRAYKYVVEVDGNVQSNRFRYVAYQDALVLQATAFVDACAAAAALYLITALSFPHASLRSPSHLLCSTCLASLVGMPRPSI